MKNYKLSLYIFILLSILAGSGAEDTADCKSAVNLSANDLHEEALENYTALLKMESPPLCAMEGIINEKRNLSIKLFELGKKFEESNQEDEARKAYIEALKNDSNNTNASEALERLDGNPILFLNQSKFNWVYGFLKNVITLIIIVIIIYKAFEYIKGRLKVKLDIQDFDKGATELDIGKGLTAMVEESIKRNIEGMPFKGIDQVQGAPNAIEMPVEIKSISPQLNLLVALVAWLTPKNVITVKGRLEKPGNRGTGLTLTMIDSNTGMIDSMTIWQKDYDPMMTIDEKEKNPSPYYFLTEMAAIWIIFRVKKHDIDRKSKSCVHKILCRYFDKYIGTFKILNTSDWKSYAYYKAGVLWVDEDIEKARIMFLKALEHDPENAGALYNAGVLLMVIGKYDRALEYFECVRTITASEPELNFLNYQSRYQIAATCHYKKIMLRQSYLLCWDKIAEKDFEDFLNRCYHLDSPKVIIKNNDTIVVELKNNNDCLFISKLKKEVSLKIGGCRYHVFNLETDYTKKNIFISCYGDLFEAEKLRCELNLNITSKIDKDLKEILQNTKQLKEKILNIHKSREKQTNLRDKKDELKKITEKIAEKLDNFNKDIELKCDICYEECVNDIKTIVSEDIQENINKKKSLEESAEKLDAGIESAFDELLTDEGRFLRKFYPVALSMYAIILANYKKEDEKAKKIIDEITFSERTCGVNYNMACYYSIISEYKKAIEYLDYALEERGPNVQWALKDPDLKGVREDEKTKQDFSIVIKKYSPQKEELPLSSIAIIGESFAKKLKEQGITTTRDLAIQAGNDQARKELSEKLGITTALLYRWALLADMMQIEDIDPSFASLLEAAGIRSLKDLKDLNKPNFSNIDNCVKKLCKINMDKSIIVPYLFRWDEIPGNDNAKLMDYLKRNCKVDCNKEIQIKKSKNDKTIRIISENKIILLCLDDGKSEVILRTNSILLNWNKICEVRRLNKHGNMVFAFKDKVEKLKRDAQNIKPRVIEYII